MKGCICIKEDTTVAEAGKGNEYGMVMGWQRSIKLELKNQSKWTDDTLMECPDPWNQLE